jgi:hypothetical protein
VCAEAIKNPAVSSGVTLGGNRTLTSSYTQVILNSTLGRRNVKVEKRSYSLDPVILRMRSAKKLVRALEKLVKLEDHIRKEVVRLGIMKHGRSG